MDVLSAVVVDGFDSELDLFTPLTLEWTAAEVLPCGRDEGDSRGRLRSIADSLFGLLGIARAGCCPFQALKSIFLFLVAGSSHLFPRASSSSRGKRRSTKDMMLGGFKGVYPR